MRVNKWQNKKGRKWEQHMTNKKQNRKSDTCECMEEENNDESTCVCVCVCVCACGGCKAC